MIVALAEELLAWVWLVAASLSGMLLSLSEALVSDTADADEPASMITSTTKAIRSIGLFIATTNEPYCIQEHGESRDVALTDA